MWWKQLLFIWFLVNVSLVFAALWKHRPSRARRILGPRMRMRTKVLPPRAKHVYYFDDEVAKK